MLLLDQRGTGASELPDDPGSLAFPRLADDVDVVRAALGIERVNLLGHSAGCTVAMAAAVAHPDRIDRLVLVTPSARGFADTSEDVRRIRASRNGEPWYAEAAETEAAAELLPEHRRGQLDRGLRPFFYGRWDDRAQAHAASADTQVSKRAAAAFVPSQRPTDYSSAALRRLTVPTLVVVGELDGSTGVEAGEVIADLLPDATVVTIDRAGHFPWVDAPDDLQDAVVGFVTG